MLPFQNVPLACPPVSMAEALPATGFKPPAPGPARLLQEPLSFPSCSSSGPSSSLVLVLVLPLLFPSYSARRAG